MRMTSRKLLSLVLALALLVSGLVCAHAEETPAVYCLGDKVEDFTVTMTDGQEISLYGLLAEKKAVLLNFWASWCGPCKREFPYLQETYTKLGNDVGMIALSINDGDTVEVIEDLKDELGVTTVPTGRDIGLAARFGVKAYPTSIIIDKNGVVCLIHESMVTSSRLLENALLSFTAEDYDKPLLLEALPALPVTQAAGSETLSAALNAEGGTLQFASMENSDTLWPFLPTADGRAASAANVAVQNTTANVFTQFDAASGDVLLFDVRMSGLTYEDRLVVTTETETLTLFTGTFDWVTHALPIAQDGAQVLAFAYVRGSQTGYDAVCELRNFRLLTGDAAADYPLPASDAPHALSGKDVTIEAVGADAMKPAYELDAEGNDLLGQTTMNIVHADSVRLKLCIGADVNASLSALMVVTDAATRETVMLADLEHDDTAYYYDLDLTRGDNLTVTLRANVLDATEIGLPMSFCATEAKAKDFLVRVMLVMLPRMSQEQIDAMGYSKLAYLDGTVICDTNDYLSAYAEYKAAHAPAKPSFTITFVDAAGTPIPGVMAQICDDTTCSVFPSDENGQVLFEGENHSYELHVLMAPAGYAVPSDTLPLPAVGGAVSVVLEAE